MIIEKGKQYTIDDFAEAICSCGAELQFGGGFDYECNGCVSLMATCENCKREFYAECSKIYKVRITDSKGMEI